MKHLDQSELLDYEVDALNLGAMARGLEPMSRDDMVAIADRLHVLVTYVRQLHTEKQR